MAKVRRKMFHVLQFIELPHDMIDEYVCVPRFWICNAPGPDRKIIVAYPPYEDRFTTIERVRKKEKPRSNWPVYRALHLYETSKYNHAINWVAMKKEIKRKSMTIKQSEYNKTANPVSSIFRQAPTKSEYLKQIQSVNIGNDYFSKNSQINSSTEPVMSGHSALTWFPDEIQPSPDRQNSPAILYRPISVSEGGFDVDDSKMQSEPLAEQTPFPETNPLVSDGGFEVKTEDDQQFEPIEEKPFVPENIVEETEPANDNDRGCYDHADDGQMQSELRREQTLFVPENIVVVRNPLFSVSEGELNVNNAGGDRMQYAPTTEQMPYVPENIVVESEPYHKTQTVPDHTGFNHFIHPPVDQATETDPVMDVNRGKGRVFDIPDERATRVVETSCQTDEYLLEEKPASCQETYSESDKSTRDEVSCNDPCVGNPYANVTTENRPIIPQSPQMPQRFVDMQEMLDLFGAMFTKLGTLYKTAHIMMNDLGKNTIECAEKYESFIQKVENYNKRLTSEISENNNSESGNDNNNINISGVAGNNMPKRHTSLLPPEYDPYDSKWTLKYRKYKPGLVELLPQANVFVSKEGIENCIRKSKDCRTLARMLLTKVFNRKALSVCSWTGGETFSSGNQRPHLDMYSKVVLLTFVEQYGAERGWNDQSGIINALCMRIEQLRANMVS